MLKYREIILSRLNTLPYFDRQGVRSIAEEFKLKEETVSSYISRSLVRKDIVQLKRGIYVCRSFYEANIGDISYKFYLANILRVPSYISTWSALSYYDLATESIGATTSVTSNITRTYANVIGTFSFNSIKPEFFRGFTLKSDKFDFYIATPAKAIFDLIYYKTNGLRGVEVDDVFKIVEELRIDINELSKEDLAEFNLLIKND